MVNDSTDYRLMMFRLHVIAQTQIGQIHMPLKFLKSYFLFVQNWLPNVKSMTSTVTRCVQKMLKIPRNLFRQSAQSAKTF